MSRRMGLLIAIFCGCALSSGQRWPRPTFHEHRESESDLEIAGKLREVPEGVSRFVSRGFLLGLPQVVVTMKHNEDFPNLPSEGVAIGGVYLDVLANGLGALEPGLAIEAFCKDGYISMYSKQYIGLHRPIFITSMDGLSPHNWALQHHAYDAGPYLIGYEDFQPAFHILAHRDRPYEPAEIQMLSLGTERAMYAGTVAKARKPSAEVAAGQVIAQQNCFRCHNAGDHGGTKAGKSWHNIGRDAKRRPRWFAEWVHDPRSLDAQAVMPPNLDYDKPTLDALQRYFATFAVEGQ